MFERTFSFWRRLVGKHPPSATEDMERRLWVRYPADVQANVHAAQQAGKRLSAKVRDISLGGANILVEQSFELGQLITLELPHAGGSALAVLACVVRTHEDVPGKFALGCVFSRELTDEDLEGFGAKRIRHAPSDKRSFQRFPSDLKARFQKVGADKVQSEEADVINLSATGVGLRVRRGLEPGALISVDLFTRESKLTKSVLACVVHVNTLADGEWGLGCNFIRELSESDLQAFI